MKYSFYRRVCKAAFILAYAIGTSTHPHQAQLHTCASTYIKFYAVRPAEKGDTLVENYNINLIPWSNLNLEISFKRFYSALPEADDFKLIDSGSANMNSREFKWLIESHTMITPKGVKIGLLNYDFAPIIITRHIYSPW